MEICMTGQALERDLAQIVDAFTTLLPDQARAMERIAAEESAIAVSSTASGAVNTVCKIPSVLFTFTRQYMRRAHGIPNFFSTHDDYKLFCKVWKAAAVTPR